MTPLSRLRRQLPSRGAFLFCTIQSLPLRGGAAIGGGEVAALHSCRVVLASPKSNVLGVLLHSFYCIIYYHKQNIL